MRYRVQLDLNINMEDPLNKRSVSFRKNHLSTPISETLLKYLQTQYQKDIIRIIDTQAEIVDESVDKKSIKKLKQKEIEIGLKLNKKELKKILKEFKEKKEKIQIKIQEIKESTKDEIDELFDIENNNLNVDEGTKEAKKDEIDEIFNFEDNNIEQQIQQEIKNEEEDEYYKIINSYKEEDKKDINKLKEKINIDELIDFFIDDDLYNPNFNKLKKIVEGE